ncbi:type II toxin-antitoxin system HigA family antitoxin [Picosynechococcus sp. PCC 7117]|uniref:helix-turn-helix domain-containing protein n=1 Tax=Picosynechococcus sp. PCC 7117 TaxID=195498 RepID=UPI0008103F3A|nr:transcriptional regulator [Picosynechococcus sp. PCC 7117]ANV88879.1 transcriptional regulator [Picosynechococcus sp. PCC 7117]
MTLTLDKDKQDYAQLLTNALPKIIETEAEYDQALGQVETLVFKAEKSLAEQALLKLLVLLIEQYEDTHHPIPTASPQAVLYHLMESNGVKQSDLVGVIGSSGVVSEVVNGKRGISKAQAKALGEFFGVDFSLFI